MAERALTVHEVRDGFYQVTEDPTWANKWWTVCQLSSGQWHIENRKGGYVRPDGRLGCRLINAVEDFQNQEDSP